MWLFHLHSMLKVQLFYPFFPLTESIAKTFCWLSFWNFKEKSINHFLWHSQQKRKRRRRRRRRRRTEGFPSVKVFPAGNLAALMNQPAAKPRFPSCGVARPALFQPLPLQRRTDEDCRWWCCGQPTKPRWLSLSDKIRWRLPQSCGMSSFIQKLPCTLPAEKFRFSVDGLFIKVVHKTRLRKAMP